MCLEFDFDSLGFGFGFGEFKVNQIALPVSGTSNIYTKGYRLLFLGRPVYGSRFLWDYFRNRIGFNSDISPELFFCVFISSNWKRFKVIEIEWIFQYRFPLVSDFAYKTVFTTSLYTKSY